MRSSLPRIVLVLSLLVASPAIAQNSLPPATPPPPTSAPPPPPTTGTTPLPPGPVTPSPQTSPPPTSNSVTVAPAPTPAPAPEPVTINPDAAYPNGFADPVDPFGNVAQPPQQSGFPWGLLGLLGLLGLIPLFRRSGGRTTRTVYVDRDDPKRVIREEQTEE